MRALIEHKKKYNPAIDQNSTRKTRIARLALYATAAVNFSIGIMEGFHGNNSVAMAINLIVSLILLSLIPKSVHFPAAVLLIGVALNLGCQIVFDMFHFLMIEQWMWLKILLIVIPFCAVPLVIGHKKLPT